MLNSQVYQLHNQNFHLAGAAAAGHKDLKELAIFTGQQNESQVGKNKFCNRLTHFKSQILSAYTPVSAAQLNGNGAQRWNIPVVAPLHGAVTENGFTNIDGGADRAIPGECITLFY